MEEKRDFKFTIHEAVWYKDRVARVEDTAVAQDGRNIYLVQTTNHFYCYAYEDELQEYIG
jgi:hypothetical protein